LVTAYDFSWIVTGVPMAIMYIILIVHIQRGNKNTWLTIVCSLLLLSNIGAVMTGYSLYKLLVLKDVTVGLVWMLGIGVGFDYGCFSIAHYLLAVEYRRMATNVPLLLEGKPEKPVTSCERFTYWTLLILNVLAGFFTGLLLYIFRMQTLIYGMTKPDAWVSNFFNIAQESVCALEIYSGVVLVNSVLRIRRFFVERNAESYINTAMLIRHATCFILYIVTVTSFYLCFGYYTIYPTKENYVYAAASGIFFNLGGCVS
jgi:hypothetical protein